MNRHMATAAKRETAHSARKPRHVEPAAPIISAPCQQASGDEVRRLAYQLWQTAGQPPGDGVQFWLEAEQQLLRRT